jgi:hypothetical protein
MTRRPHDASTSDEPVAAAPSRPAAVELAAAVLIVGGIVALFGVLSSLVQGLGDQFTVLSIALDAGMVLAGVLARMGRAWLLVVNYVAVLGFLDLVASGTSPLALMLGILDVIVVVVLLANKPWFDALSTWRSERRERQERRVSP